MEAEPRVRDGSVVKRLRPDLSSISQRGESLLDISILHPGAASHSAARPGASMRQRASSKARKYRQLADEAQSAFCPFVLECFGTMDPLAIGFLKSLAKDAEAEMVTDRFAFFRHAVTSISFALQRGNALVMSRALTLVRVEGARRVGGALSVRRW